MQPITHLTGLVVPLDRANIDTDAIIPKQFIKSIRKTGFGPYLFDEWRYLDRGELGQDCSTRSVNAQFALNQPRYRGATILLARENFGCGSSREHAAWALSDYGIRAIIAPSFADIFRGNCYKNAILPVVLDASVVDELFAAVAAAPGYALAIDLEAQAVTTPQATVHRFMIDPFHKNCLLNGLDDIAITLRKADKIRGYEQWRGRLEPWLFANMSEKNIG